MKRDNLEIPLSHSLVTREMEVWRLCNPDEPLVCLFSFVVRNIIVYNATFVPAILWQYQRT